MDKKESVYWDLVKGVAIFLMLWGHCIQYCAQDEGLYFYDTVYKAIYSFHMPAFMLISGYLFHYSFQKRSLTELLEHRIRGMLHPIVMATIFSNILLLVPSYILSNHAEILFGSLFQGISNYFWFLWAVLYCSVIVGICAKATNRLYLQFCLTILGAFVILLLPQWNMTLFMYPYFVAGFFCGMKRDYAWKLYKSLKYAMLVIFPFMTYFYRTKHFIYITPMFSEELGLSASAKIALFRWVIGFAGCIWLLAMIEFVLRLGERIPVIRSCITALSHLGKNSLQIYCLSLPLLSGYLPHLYRKFVEVIGYNLFAPDTFVFDYIFTPALAVAYSLFLYYIIVLLRKCKLHKLIFGR